MTALAVDGAVCVDDGQRFHRLPPWRLAEPKTAGGH